MPVINASGTQSATVGTEHILASPSTSGVYALVVDASELQDGDTLELRIYLQVLASSSLAVGYKVTYKDAQSIDDAVKVSVPVPTTHQVQVTLKQTTGTGRGFAWELIAL